MIFSMGSGLWGRSNQVWDKQISNQYQQNNLWPFCVHTNQQYAKYSETKTWRNRTWERIPSITRNAPGRTLAAITPFRFLCAFPPENPLMPAAPKRISQSSNACSPNPCPLSRIYIFPQDLNLFPKGKNLLFPFFFSSFLKSSNQKQSSQFQIPLQNLPRRVPPSLNSNGKFPYKNMKFLKLNHWMNK